MPLDGNSTNTVKNGLEAIVSYSLQAMQDVGKYVCEEPGSGEYTADPDFAFPNTGVDLALRVIGALESEDPMVVTIVGTDQDDAALEGTATIGGQVSRGQAYEVVPETPGKRFKTISSVTATNGEAGDGFEIVKLPDSNSWNELCFIENVELNEGTTTRPVYCRFEVDHNKRARGENTLTMAVKHTNHLNGLPRIKDRDVTLRLAFHDDGQAGATETWIIAKARVSTPLSVPEEDDATVRGEGNFGKYAVFS